MSSGHRFSILALALSSLVAAAGLSRLGVESRLPEGLLPESALQIVEPGLATVALELLRQAGSSSVMLSLVAEAEPECGHVYPLQVSRMLTKDALYVDIGAYGIERTAGVEPCEKSAVRATASVPIEDALPKSGARPTKIILGGSQNEFRLRQDSYAVYLEQVKSNNVSIAGGTSATSFVLCHGTSPSLSAPPQCREK